ncbi:hypothetical protein Hypma_003197 [Hypsizygus marmoreus]|uniref:F-box domain-containing protein n=1 Tax=Hypsizygus marmoreus TaxID=39966 RepID=A0A369K2M8_HYPMA|nr:hypothetical protein Hypma_003197 [Hypsizygus marmoreus]
MPFATFPQELIDNVIDHFHDDTPTLRLCSVVCRAWLPSCRAHLFHRVSLQPPKVQPRAYFDHGKTSDVQRLYRIIQSSPDIADYIRDLVVCEGMLGREWIIEEKTLPLLLRKLHNVQQFQLHRPSAHIMWRGLPWSLKDAIESVLASPSLLQLKLARIAFDRPADLLSILQCCRTLRDLHIEHLLLLEDPLDAHPVSQSIRQHSPLDVLTVGPRTSTGVISCLLHPESTIDVTSIRKLSLSISGHFADFSRVLRSASSVESLELILMSDIDLQAYQALSSSEYFDMSYNPHLRTLDIKIDVIQRQDDPLSFLNTLFSTFTTPNSLHDIYIVYSLYLPAPYMDRSMNTAIFNGWREIDSTLTSFVFQHLKSVKLEFSLENPIGFDVAPRFLKEVDLQSPALDASGIFVVDAFDTSI